MIKKFILKSLVFTLPFFVSFFAVTSLGSFDKGDLLRLSNLVDRTSYYWSTFNDIIPRELLVKSLEDTKSQKKFNILTIGDSFSQQKEKGYQNLVTFNSDLSVLNVPLGGNPIQHVYGLLNGDFFDSLSFDYVVVQCAEKYATTRNLRIDSAIILNFKNLQENSITPNRISGTNRFFSPKIIKFPVNNFLYKFSDNAIFSKVYKTEIEGDNLFSVKNPDLLFFYEDLIALPSNNDKANVFKLNKELNKLAYKLEKRKLQLIFLVSPDKYDLYYDNILNKQDYKKPLFFDYFNDLEKNYLSIDAKNILENQLGKTKDLYYYDDTHWSPEGAKLIAHEMVRVINSAKFEKTR